MLPKPSVSSVDSTELTHPAPVQHGFLFYLGKLRLPPFGALLSEWAFCNIGHYAVLAILSLYLLVTLRLAASTAALMLLFASLAFRLARFFVAPLLDHLSPRAALLIATALGSIGYFGLLFTAQPLLMMLCFIIIGVGYGSNAILIKVLAAPGQGTSRLMRYASINTSLNIGAAVGPVIGNTLFLHWNPHLLFFFPAGMFALAGLVSLMLPTAETQQQQRVRWITMLGQALNLPIVRQNLLFVFAGFFLYSQLFATLPLITNTLFHTPELLSSFFALNALIIVFGQVPATRLLVSLKLSPRLLLRTSFLMYVAGFVLIWLLPYWQVAYPAVVLWTTGEMLIFPSLDTLLAGEITAELRVTCFSLSAVAVAFAEGIGSLLGVWIIGYLTPLNQLRQLYLLFAIIAMLGFVASLLIRGRSSSQESLPKAS